MGRMGKLEWLFLVEFGFELDLKFLILISGIVKLWLIFFLFVGCEVFGLLLFFLGFFEVIIDCIFDDGVLFFENLVSWVEEFWIFFLLKSFFLKIFIRKKKIMIVIMK